MPGALPVPPPIVRIESSGMPVDNGRLMLVMFDSGVARCAGSVASPISSERPVNRMTRLYGNEASTSQAGNIRLTFAIDARGRPVSIAGGAFDHTLRLDTSDLAPALAAWRFLADAPRQSCEIQFTAHKLPLADAPVEEVRRFVATPPADRLSGSAYARPAFDRSVPPGGTCYAPSPTLLEQHFPNPNRIPQPAGTASWTFFSHDIDAAGRPANIRMLASSGNAVLDRAVAASLRRNRFARGARKGCVYRHYLPSREALAAPERPADSFQKPEDNCPGTVANNLTIPTALRFPPNFEHRRIEGYAIMRFDVAPWGALGNITVARAEPAQDFGNAARMLLAQAKAPATDRGYVGCYRTVRYSMPALDAPPPDQ